MRAASKDSQGRNLASQETGIFGLSLSVTRRVKAGGDVNEWAEQIGDAESGMKLQRDGEHWALFRDDE